MHVQQSNRRLARHKVMPETLETLLSALLGCGLVLLLAFFLSLEAWVTSWAAVG